MATPPVTKDKAGYIEPSSEPKWRYNGEIVGAAIDFFEEGEEATDDVDDAKHSGRLDLVLVFEVGLM